MSLEDLLWDMHQEAQRPPRRVSTQEPWGVEELAQALCDSSSHMNLMPRAEQRPCDYHRKRAANTLKLLRRRP